MTNSIIDHKPDTDIKIKFDGTRCAFYSNGRAVSDIYLYNQYALLAASSHQAADEANDDKIHAPHVNLVANAPSGCPARPANGGEMSNEILEKLNELLAAEQELNKLLKADNAIVTHQRNRLLAAASGLIAYRDRAGALNFQLEKADDFINQMRAAVTGQGEAR